MLLAWRVTSILKALGVVAAAHEQNILNLSKALRGGPLLIFSDSPKHVQRAQGMGLLIAGFTCLGISALLQIAAQVLQGVTN